MYIGNGVTKRFPLPKGNDGSVVILKFPNGKGVHVTENEGYTVKNGTVYFFVAPPSGVEVCFSDEDISEIEDVRKQLVIYSDGSYIEVDEDPVVILEEAKKLFSQAQTQMNELRDLISSTKTYISHTISDAQADLDGRLASYQALADKAVSVAAMEVRKEIIDEWLPMYRGLENARTDIFSDINKLEKLKDEIKRIARLTAESTANKIKQECESVIRACEEIRALGPEIKASTLDAQSQVKRTGYEVSSEIKLQLNTELELLKTLRAKMEADYQKLNTQLNNRWDIFREMKP